VSNSRLGIYPFALLCALISISLLGSVIFLQTRPPTVQPTAPWATRWEEIPKDESGPFFPGVYRLRAGKGWIVAIRDNFDFNYVYVDGGHCPLPEVK
jgi:hypothetical protein